MNLKQEYTTRCRQAITACGVVLALALTGSTSAQTWTDIGPNDEGWDAVACSADGTKIIAARINGLVYFSTNSGVNWIIAPLPGGFWYSAASSADGSKLFAGGRNNFYVSTNSGLTWATNTAEGADFTQISCSADGTRVAVASPGDGILCSTDSGATFTTNAVPTPGGFGSIVSSADGTELVGMQPWVNEPAYDDAIYRSVDSGVTWTQTGAPLGSWGCLACSADGTTIAAVGDELGISKNSGVTWVTNTMSGVPCEIACSADGTRLIVAGRTGDSNDIYTSLDSGQTWVTNNAPGEPWSGVAMSADGSVLFGAGIGLFMAQIPAQPSLSIRPCGTNVTLSWPLPSAGFVLQQSADLTSTNWENVTNGVTPTNYWKQVTVAPPAGGNAFYRLAGP